MTDTLDHLEAQLRSTDAPDQPTEGWSITGLETAAWASRKAAEALLAHLTAAESREELHALKQSRAADSEVTA